jgi:hypothetical protein
LLLDCRASQSMQRDKCAPLSGFGSARLSFKQVQQGCVRTVY